MLTSLLVAASVAVAPVGSSAAAAPVITYDNERTNTQYPLVHQVLCEHGAGTAFRINGNTFYSVAHVSALGHCEIDGNPVVIIEQDGLNDFSILQAGPQKLEGLKISCEGYKTSEWYWAVGYAYGLPYQTSVALYSTAFNDKNGERMFIGKHVVIPGMSGGPILNSKGEVGGTVNMYNPFFGISYSRSLKDTSVCKNKRSEGDDARAPQLSDYL